jgi:hypothetical protein
MSFIVWRGENDSEISFCHRGFQFFDDSLSLSRELIKNQRFKTPTSQHRFELIARGLVVAVHHEDLLLGRSESCRDLFRSCRSQCRLHLFDVLALNVERPFVEDVHDCFVRPTELRSRVVGQPALVHDLEAAAHQQIARFVGLPEFSVY